MDTANEADLRSFVDDVLGDDNLVNGGDEIVDNVVDNDGESHHTDTSDPAASPRIESQPDADPNLDSDGNLLREADSPQGAMASLMGDESEDDAEGVAEHSSVISNLLDLYQAAGVTCPELTGPDCFTANDLDFHQALVWPTTSRGDWMRIVDVIHCLPPKRISEAPCYGAPDFQV